MDNNFVIYPNPATSSRVFFAQPTTYELYDIQGRKIKAAQNSTFINVDSLNAGTYIVKNDVGQTQKLIIK